VYYIIKERDREPERNDRRKGKEEIMNNTYEAWVMMDSELAVVSEEHDTPEEVLVEMMEEYTIEEMHEAGFTCNKLLCDGKCWLECLEEVDY